MSYRLSPASQAGAGCLTVHAIHGELAHALPTAGMLCQGLLRALPALLLQPGAALGAGRGQAHGHHHMGAQGLHLHTILLERGSQGHHGQRAAAESAVGFGETPAGGTEAKVTQSAFFPPSPSPSATFKCFTISIIRAFVKSV